MLQVFFSSIYAHLNVSLCLHLICSALSQRTQIMRAVRLFQYYIVAFSLPKSDIFRNFLLPFFEFLLSPYHHPPTQISHIHTHFCVLTSDRFSGGSHIDHQHWTHQIRNNFDLGYTFSDRAIGRWLSWIYPITFVVIVVLGGFALGWVNTNISRIYIQRRHTKWDLFGGSAKSDEWFSARGSRSIRAYRISLRNLGKFV